MHSTAFVNITSHSQYRKMFFYFLSYLFKSEDRNNFLFPPLWKCRITQGEASQVAERLHSMFANQGLHVCQASFQDVWILRVGTHANQHHRPPPGPEHRVLAAGKPICASFPTSPSYATSTSYICHRSCPPSGVQHPGQPTAPMPSLCTVSSAAWDPLFCHQLRIPYFDTFFYCRVI
jgi:hypothetical protein